MSYSAYITILKDVQKHPNADRLQIATCFGNQVIVGLDNYEGEVGIYFPTDGRLSKEFLEANNLISYKDPVTGEKKGGFFDERGKVRAQKFRGQKSDGFWCPLSYLIYLGFSDTEEIDLPIGTAFCEVKGQKICEKYETPQTIKAKQNKQKQPKKQHPSFPKHYDTEQFEYNKDWIPDGSLIYISEKLHGTSGRFGRVWTSDTLPNPWYRRMLGLKPKTIEGFSELNGTRNIVLGKSDKSFYVSESFRDQVVQPWKHLVQEGEVIYFEIVGYTNTGQLIMPKVPTKELKEIKAIYGDSVTYSYGCLPDGVSFPEYYASDYKLTPQTKIFVYRIIRTDREGNYVEYSWPQVVKRCREMNIPTVPLTDVSGIIDSLGLNKGRPYVWTKFDSSQISNWIITRTEEVGNISTVANTNPMEGICLRIEPPDRKPYTLKYKTFAFKVMEGIIKDSADYIDLEEIS